MLSKKRSVWNLFVYYEGRSKHYAWTTEIPRWINLMTGSLCWAITCPICKLLRATSFSSHNYTLYHRAAWPDRFQEDDKSRDQRVWSDLPRYLGNDRVMASWCVWENYWWDVWDRGTSKSFTGNTPKKCTLMYLIIICVNNVPSQERDGQMYIVGWGWRVNYLGT